MSDVRFNNNNPEFRNLVQQARQLSRDGLTPDELATLQHSAETNNLHENGKPLTGDEKLFLNALTNEENLRLLNSANFNPANFTMDIINRSSSVSTPVSANPLNNADTQVDSGEQVSQDLNDPNFSANELRSQINNIFINFLHTPVPRGVQSLVDNFNSDREALIYIRNLGKRAIGMAQPPLDTGTIDTVCSQINSMSRTSHHPSAGHSRSLAVSALHDVALPSDISQGSIASCEGTSIQIQLALRDPVQYLSMLDTLAEGNAYHTSSGEMIQPNFTFVNDSSGRNISSKIMQNAIMDHADGSRNYNSSVPSASRDGLWDPQAAGMMNTLFPGQNYHAFVNQQQNNQPGSTGNYSSEQLLGILRGANASRSNPVLISMMFMPPGQQHAYHAVNVVQTNNQGATIINPWGREEFVNWEQMRQRISGIVSNNNTVSG